jgi:hypothetical protein
MSQSVIRQNVTAEARIRSEASPRGICGRQASNGGRVFSQYFGFPLSVSFHQCSIFINSSADDDASTYQLTTSLNEIHLTEEARDEVAGILTSEMAM